MGHQGRYGRELERAKKFEKSDFAPGSKVSMWPTTKATLEAASSAIDHQCVIVAEPVDSHRRRYKAEVRF